MHLSVLLSVLALPADCPPPERPHLLVLTAADPALREQVPRVEPRVRSVLAERVPLLSASHTERVLTAEGGAAVRRKTLLDARIAMKRAHQQFRSLEDGAAIESAAEITARLTAISQTPGAIELLAEAHLLAGAIFLARGRIDAAHLRLRRALQLAPDLEAPADRYVPQVRAELAGLRGDPGPLGRLDVQLAEPYVDTEVFVDGRSRGTAPVRLRNISVGRHLVRVSAPGHRSFHTTVRIGRDRPTSITARLSVDDETRELRDLSKSLQPDAVRESVLTLLARRADDAPVVLGELRLGAERTPTATASAAVVLHMAGRSSQASSLDPEDLGRSIEALLRCEPNEVALTAAPALLEWPPARSTATTVEQEPPLWTRPWVWAVFAIVLVGTASALAATRQAEGPPDAVDITLVPRP